MRCASNQVAMVLWGTFSSLFQLTVSAGLLLVHLHVPRKPISLLNMLSLRGPLCPVLHSFHSDLQPMLQPGNNILYTGRRYISPSLRGKQDITAKGLSDGSIRHPLSPPIALPLRLPASQSQHTNKLPSWKRRRRLLTPRRLQATQPARRLANVSVSSSAANTPSPHMQD